MIIALFTACTDETEQDETPDDDQESLSFFSTISWPEGQQLPRFTEPEQLDVVDVLNEPGDIKLLFATLQGIVNRQQPRIYLLENSEEGKFTWLKDLDIPYELHRDYFTLIEKYNDELEGMVIYDPNLPDSINVATTLAGIKKAVVVSPELSEVLKKEPYQLEVIKDLQGKFSSKIEAYEWQLEHLWPETTHYMLVGLSPGHPIEQEGEDEFFTVIAEEETQEREAKNKDEYVFDLSEFINEEAVYIKFEDAFPEDGWGPAVHRVTVTADDEVIIDFKADTSEEEKYLYDEEHSQVSDGQGGHRFADHDSYFIYEFPYSEGTEELVATVEMWNQYKISVSGEEPSTIQPVEPFGYLRDYAVANQAMVFWLAPHETEERRLFDQILDDIEPGTPYLGWFADDVKGEFGGVEYVSRHGVYVVPTDFFSNLTVFSGVRAEIEPIEREFDVNLENKIYVTLMFGEGDNLQYNQHRMRVMWDDAGRGKVPVNWTSSPLLYDAAPTMLQYYQQTATENDLLITGPSGVGYFYADPWPKEHFSTFLRDTYPYLTKTGMTVPYVLNRINEQNMPLSEESAKAYEEEYQANGLLLSWEGRRGITILNENFPVSIIHGVGSIQEGQEVLEEIKEQWDGESPTFISIGLLAWNLNPTDVFVMTNSLGPEYEIVLADEYIALLREAYELDED